MAKAHWYILTKYLKKTGEIKTGLTIPYLYGAYKRLGYDINSIEDLLKEILSTNTEELPVIEKCDLIKFDVVKLETKVSVNRNRKKEVRITGKGYPNEIVISYNTNLGRDLAKVSVSLEALYQKYIDDQTYTWYEKKWHKFGETEYKIIDSLK